MPSCNVVIQSTIYLCIYLFSPAMQSQQGAQRSSESGLCGVWLVWEMGAGLGVQGSFNQLSIYLFVYARLLGERSMGRGAMVFTLCIKSSTSDILSLNSAALRSSLPSSDDMLPTTTPKPDAPRMMTMMM